MGFLWLQMAATRFKKQDVRVVCATKVIHMQTKMYLWLYFTFKDML